ncbi:MAG TPA: hypothetical protein VJ783_32235 [Pirellulales bacterium]|nr:hypothetical protein [Pirellulales bacterium]
MAVKRFLWWQGALLVYGGWLAGAATYLVATLPARRAAIDRAERAERQRDQARAEVAGLRVTLRTADEALAASRVEIRLPRALKKNRPHDPRPTLRGGLTLATRCVSPWFVASFGRDQFGSDDEDDFQWRAAWKINGFFVGVLSGTGSDDEHWERLVYAATPVHPKSGDPDELRAQQIAAGQSLLEAFVGDIGRDQRDWLARAIAALADQPDGAKVVEEFRSGWGPTRATTRATVLRRSKTHVLLLEPAIFSRQTARADGGIR